MHSKHFFLESLDILLKDMTPIFKKIMLLKQYFIVGNTTGVPPFFPLLLAPHFQGPTPPYAFPQFFFLKAFEFC